MSDAKRNSRGRRAAKGKSKGRGARKGKGRAKRAGKSKAGRERGRSETPGAAMPAREPRAAAEGTSRAPRRQARAASPATTKRPAQRARRIDVVLKGLAVAAEPPIDANPGSLDPAFRNKLQLVLTRLAAAGTPFRLVEGFRTRARQQWLFGSGRPKVMPFGRPGPVLTNADGVDKPSRHQGNGRPGSGRAADCYPTREGRVFIPPSSDPVWAAYADAAEAEGLVAGHRFPTLKDSPHCELR